MVGPPQVSNLNAFSHMEQVYLAARSRFHEKRAALDVIETAPGIPVHLEDQLAHLVDRSFESAQAALGALIEFPAPGVGSAAKKLRLLIDDVFSAVPIDEPVYTHERPDHFLLEAALSQILIDLERLSS